MSVSKKTYKKTKLTKKNTSELSRLRKEVTNLKKILAKMPPPKDAKLGYTHKKTEGFRVSTCWYCGDYTYSYGGGSQWSGRTLRICSPDWTGCPATAKLDDGSVWTFIGNCKCDG